MTFWKSFFAIPDNESHKICWLYLAYSPDRPAHAIYSEEKLTPQAQARAYQWQYNVLESLYPIDGMMHHFHIFATAVMLYREVWLSSRYPWGHEPLALLRSWHVACRIEQADQALPYFFYLFEWLDSHCPKRFSVESGEPVEGLVSWAPRRRRIRGTSQSCQLLSCDPCADFLPLW